VEEIPDLPMRMAGVVEGSELRAVLEIGGESRVVWSGEVLGPYRVESIESTKMVLSKAVPGGRRTIALPLQANPALRQQYSQSPAIAHAARTYPRYYRPAIGHPPPWLQKKPEDTP
jgi:hypothetical protein